MIFIVDQTKNTVLLYKNKIRQISTFSNFSKYFVSELNFDFTSASKSFAKTSLSLIEVSNKPLLVTCCSMYVNTDSLSNY
jgi:hypothetical protein